MSWYYNAVGERFRLPEQALEPGDCWQEEPEEMPACICSRRERAVWYREYTFGNGMGAQLEGEGRAARL